MKNGRCPKCGSAEVSVLGKRRAHGIGVMNISMFSMAYLDNYVCTACGYVESYVSDMTKLPEIAKKWRNPTRQEPRGSRQD